jgi:ornithine carbamoyltransferase
MKTITLPASRHVRGVLDLAPNLAAILQASHELKRRARRGVLPGLLAGKTILLLFEKNSTRTRVSLEVGIQRLGGQVVSLDAGTSQLARGESLEDTAKVLSRYADAIVHRARDHQSMLDLAAHATVPVINALTDREHPLQLLADMMSLQERWGDLRGKTIAWVGDGNNVCQSTLLMAPLLGMHVRVATPPQHAPNASVVAEARALARMHGTRITMTNDPRLAVQGADAVVTDTWVSMGDEADREERLAAFAGFTVDEELLALGNNALFLHCLPGHWGEEATEDVARGPRSLIYDQAENRMWTQMAVLAHLLHGRPITGLRGAA